MKRNWILMFMLSAFVLAGSTSCKEEVSGGSPGDDGAVTGTMKLTLGFDRTSGAGTYATISDAKPTTSWAGSIKSLAVFFVDQTTKEIKNAQAVPYDSNADMANQSKTIMGVPVGTYDVYVFANWDQGSVDWSVAAAKGRNISDLYMSALANDDYLTYRHQTSEASSNGYGEAPEVFVAMHQNIQIQADQTVTDTTPYALTRIVSLVRVRIDQSVDNDQNRNETIDFQHADASLRIRRINTGVNLLYTDALRATTTRRTESDANTAVFFAKQPFKDAEPTSGYSTGAILTDNFTSWADVKLIPAGSATVGTEKLDVVITGITKDAQYVPAGYPKEENGATVSAAPIGAQIVWLGSVSYELKGNGIMELNLTLRSAGTWVDPNDPDKPLPEPQEYGNLEVQVNLADWGNIEQVDMEL